MTYTVVTLPHATQRVNPAGFCERVNGIWFVCLETSNDLMFSTSNGVVWAKAFDYRGAWAAVSKSGLYGGRRMSTWYRTTPGMAEPVTTARPGGYIQFDGGLARTTQYRESDSDPTLHAWTLKHAATLAQSGGRNVVCLGTAGGGLVIAAGTHAVPNDLTGGDIALFSPTKRATIPSPGVWIYQSSALTGDRTKARVYYSGGGGGTYCRVDEHSTDDGAQTASTVYSNANITTSHVVSLVFIHNGAVTHQTAAIETATTSAQINAIVPPGLRQTAQLSGVFGNVANFASWGADTIVNVPPFNAWPFSVYMNVSPRADNTCVLPHMIDNALSALPYRANMACSPTKMVAEVQMPKAAGGTRLVFLDGNGIVWNNAVPGSGTSFGYDIQRV